MAGYPPTYNYDPNLRQAICIVDHYLELCFSSQNHETVHSTYNGIKSGVALRHYLRQYDNLLAKLEAFEQSTSLVDSAHNLNKLYIAISQTAQPQRLAK